MPMRSSLARVCRGLVPLGMLISVLLALVWLGSSRLELSLAGKPYFFLRSEVTEGALIFDVLLPNGDGSRSGWGNPGWRLHDTGSARLRWIPRVVESRPSRRVFVIPLWIPLLAAVTATLALRRLAPHRAPGDCRHCGYDLSGVDPHTPCPECGQSRDAPHAGVPQA